MTGPSPQVAAIRSAIRRELSDIDQDRTVIVACSGGQDSLALAAGLAFVATHAKEATRWRTVAVVIDHGLQTGSDSIAQRAAQQCLDLGIEHVEVIAVSVPDDGPCGPEAQARDVRYAALEQAAVAWGATTVLLGHTMDDQAETVILRLARGSGARSLSGIPPRRGIFRRPLLGIGRADTLVACVAQGLAPWHDPTNTVEVTDEQAPARSRVRAWLAQQRTDMTSAIGQDPIASLARTADQLRDDADLLDALADQLLASILVQTGEYGVIGLDAKGASSAPAALRRRAIRLAALRVGCPPGDMGYSHVLTVDALLTDYRGQGPIRLPGGVSVRRRSKVLIFEPGSN